MYSLMGIVECLLSFKSKENIEMKNSFSYYCLIHKQICVVDTQTNMCG